MPERGARVELVDASRWYGDGPSRIDALEHATISIDPGQMVAVVGPSGSGKSTLLQVIGLLDRASEGTVRIDGRDVAHLPDRELTRMRLDTIGFVFQRFHLLGGMTAIENVALPLEAAGVGASARYARAAALLNRVGLGGRAKSRPNELSGGQRQRVAIARALSNDARLVLADEPTGALHGGDRNGIIALLREVNSEGTTVVIVTHDESVAAICERRLEMRDGVVTEATVTRRPGEATHADGPSGPTSGRIEQVMSAASTDGRTA